MLIGAQSVGVWLVAEAYDMRKSIDGLAQAVVDALQRQPLSGEVFVFGNRARDKIKLLWWDRHGFWLAYKRLERGRFRWPRTGGADVRQAPASCRRTAALLPLSGRI